MRLVTLLPIFALIVVVPVAVLVWVMDPTGLMRFDASVIVPVVAVLLMVTFICLSIVFDIPVVHNLPYLHKVEFYFQKVFVLTKKHRT